MAQALKFVIYEDRVMEGRGPGRDVSWHGHLGHDLTRAGRPCHLQTVAYGELSNENPAPITPEYECKADAVIELQLERAGVRLAYLLDANLVPDVAGQKTESADGTPFLLAYYMGLYHHYIRE
jgi:hypothetical protein